MNELAVYFEGAFFPEFGEILAEAIKTYPVDQTYVWNEFTNRTWPVLCLGAEPEVKPINWVKAPSQKQIMASASAMTDLRAALDRLYTPVSFPPMSFAVVDGLTDEEESALGDVLVVDIEVGGNIKVDLPEDTWLISLAINDGKNIYVFTEESMQEDTLDNCREQLIRILTSGRKLVAHNMKFDFRTVSAQLGVEIKGHHDTMLMHHSINPGAKQHGLKESCHIYLGAPDWDSGLKQWVGSDGHYEKIPREALYTYNAWDVYWTWYLMEFLIRAAVGDSRLAKLARFEFEMSNFFQDVEGHGAAVDLEYLGEIDTFYAEEWDAILNKLRSIVEDENFNPNSPVQVKKWYQSHGFPEMDSTAEKILEVLEFDTRTQELFTEALLEARGITKMWRTYVKGIERRVHNGNLVYPSFKVHGTTTGRTSSADPNIQNVPRDEEGKLSLRRLFVPRAEGRSLLQVDYSQAELRVMACLSEDDYLISLFQPGMPDFFDSLLPSTFPNDDVASWDKATKKNNRAKLKTVIYGLAYNRKEWAIAKELKISVEEARTIIRNFLKAAPKFAEWRKWVQLTALSPDRQLVSPFGRYYQAEVVTSKNRQNVLNSALAFLPQSTASDLCITAAMKVHEQIKGSDVLIIATIHDAILFDTPDEQIERVAALAQREMEASGDAVFNGVVPFATEATHGKSWMGI
jgi:DNA polymerase I-like protein with 3'-5' exonuclease and polymerase domains